MIGKQISTIILGLMLIVLLHLFFTIYFSHSILDWVLVYLFFALLTIFMLLILKIISVFFLDSMGFIVLWIFIPKFLLSFLFFYLFKTNFQDDFSVVKIHILVGYMISSAFIVLFSIPLIDKLKPNDR